jgi:tetratricopeptide (TPR) repeat protein
MRTNLFRGVLAVAVLLSFAVAPAFAQSIVRGKVLDAQNKPVEGATVTFEAEGTNRKAQTKTNNKGEFLQVGLSSGPYKMTATKEGVGTHELKSPVSQGRPVELTFHLATAAAGGGDAKANAEIQAAAASAIEAMRAGRHDEAITKFNDLVTKVPTCSDCYYNLGVAYTAKQQYAEAETAYKKAVELKPDSGEAYTGLANVYNAQKKFDLASEASTKASQLTSASGGGGGAEATYNQGVILFNSGKFAEAKTQFEAAVKADPNYGPAYYQLGMAALNVGQIPDAVAALEKYLQVAPDGPKAAEVKTSLPALQGMLKK